MNFKKNPPNEVSLPLSNASMLCLQVVLFIIGMRNYYGFSLCAFKAIEILNIFMIYFSLIYYFFVLISFVAV